MEVTEHIHNKATKLEEIHSLQIAVARGDQEDVEMEFGEVEIALPASLLNTTHDGSSKKKIYDFTHWIHSNDIKYNQKDWEITKIPQSYGRNGFVESNLLYNIMNVAIPWKNDSTVPVEEFHRFRHLPVEVRERIWKLVLPGPRLLRIELTRCKDWSSWNHYKEEGGGINIGLSVSTDFDDKDKIATLRSICRESNQFLLKRYSPVLVQKKEEIKPSKISEGRQSFSAENEDEEKASNKPIINKQALSSNMSTELYPNAHLIDYKVDVVELCADETLTFEFRYEHNFLDLTHVRKLALNLGCHAEFICALPKICPELKHITVITGKSYDYVFEKHHARRVFLPVESLREVRLQDLDTWKQGEHANNRGIPSNSEVHDFVDDASDLQTTFKLQATIDRKDPAFWGRVYLTMAANGVVYTETRPFNKQHYLLPLKQEYRIPGVVFHTQEPILTPPSELVRISEFGCWTEQIDNDILIAYHEPSTDDSDGHDDDSRDA